MNRPAFVLAAGLGTRLQPLTLHRPKPLVPVCGVPMLAYALALCHRHGLDRVVVNAHHLAEQLQVWEGVHEGVDVRISVESPEILGTGGGLKLAAPHLAERVAVVNADVLCDVDLRALLDAVPDGGAALSLRPHEVEVYGPVLADSTGTIVKLRHHASTDPVGDVADDTHFTGIHALHRSVLGRVPEGFACIVRSAYKQMVGERRLRGVRHEGLWLDVGDPAAYLSANLAVLTTAVPLPLDPFPRAAFATGPRGQVGQCPPGVTVTGSAWVGAEAALGRGVVLQDTVIGERALVAPGAELTRCVVWDGARVPAGSWRNAIFFEGGYLPVVHGQP